MGMEKVYLCMDVQLYAVTKQVCWNQPKKFHNVVVHPGGNAYHIVIPWLHWNVNERLWIGMVCHYSLWIFNGNRSCEHLGV